MSWLFSFVSNLFQNIVFQTVISGVLVFVLGETIQRFFLLPLQNYKGVIGKIDNQLKFYDNIISNSGTDMIARDKYIACSDVLRKLSCELEVSFKQLPITRLNTRQKISESAQLLIRLSNNLGRAGEGLHNSEDIRKIRKNLGIQSLSS